MARRTESIIQIRRLGNVRRYHTVDQREIPVRLTPTLIEGGEGRSPIIPRAYLLTEEHVIIFPIFANGKAFAETTVFVRFGNDPRGVHERLSCYRRILRSSQSVVSVHPYLGSTWRSPCSTRQRRLRRLQQKRAVLRWGNNYGRKRLTINDVPEVGVARQVGHQTFHSFYALYEVDDLFFRGLLVQCSDNVVNGFAEDRRQTMTHGGMGEGILVVSSKRRPGRVLFRRDNKYQLSWRLR